MTSPAKIVKGRSDPVSPLAFLCKPSRSGMEHRVRTYSQLGDLHQVVIDSPRLSDLGGVLGSTGNCVGRRQRVEGHPLEKRVEATTTADNNYALAA